MLKTLLDRLRNEITRLPAVRGFNTLADSPLPLDFSSVLEPMVQELTSFLRKALRPLRLAALLALEVRGHALHMLGSACCIVSAKHLPSFVHYGLRGEVWWSARSPATIVCNA